MSVVPRVGRRSLPVFTFLSTAYVLLIAGAVSMVVPFLIMLSSAVSNEWDYEQFHIIPKYLHNERELYMKFVTEKYLDVRAEFPRDYRLFSAAYSPGAGLNSFKAMRDRDDWLESGPLAYEIAVGREEQSVRVYEDYVAWMTQYDRPLLKVPMFARFTQGRYQEFMRELYEQRYTAVIGADAEGLSAEELAAGALDLMVATWDEARFTEWFYVSLGPSANYPYHLRVWMPALDEKRMEDYIAFVQSLPADWKTPITARHLWLRYLENAAGSIDEFNEKTGLGIQAYNQLPFPDQAPENPAYRALWETFVRERWPLWMLDLPSSFRDDWNAYLKRRAGSLERLNRLVNEEFPAWDDVPFPGTPPKNPLMRNFWRDFLDQLPTEVQVAHRFYPEQDYRRWLLEKYGSVAGLNQAYGWELASIDQADIPLAEVDYNQFLRERGWFKGQFLTFNFRRVFGYMAIQGRAVFNTFILVVLAIGSCLTVNPLAAYALSRFQLKHTQKILLFLLATMAFPAEVSMIPNFLMLRQLGLLNTFAALVLPGLANGFAIFLLKGFFDSLPRELYEAATIDGASEWTMFTRVTLPLCKPILAYQALLAFIAAYGGFMWAFLVCQDQRMWTIMVWIYQYQQTAASYPYMIMSAFVLASIPTLLVFLFCQKIILRGIIIPTMK